MMVREVAVADVIQPVRMRLSRSRGFNLQKASQALNGLSAVNVARPTRWGNPWRITHQPGAGWAVEGPRLPFGYCRCGNEEGAALKAVGFFRQHVEEGHLPGLPPAGQNLACWCALDAPCHADVLLRLANVRCEALDIAGAA